MTAEQRARHNAYHREYQLNRYHANPEVRKAVIERAKRCTVKRAVAALTAEQAAKRRASDAARQARHRAAKKAAATAAP
jgi:hypothetical protein